MVEKRINWSQFFMTQAAILSTRSTCTRLHVGAIVVKDNRVIAEGYNGSVAGTPHCTEVGDYIVDGHCVRAIHAEQNALVQAANMGISVDGAEIYVTDIPCVHCTKLLLQAGIKKINYMRDYNNDPFARELIEQKGVGFTKIPLLRETIGAVNLEQFIED
ncbi:MAG: cytidine/deoxycytidylate deaminase family protein [Lactobacillaceae bacterium]|jgi:dCMP deaminase|nr:cytidine/deoxycytidylate deaminase family protein [Lactobacillaceae bacterium]